MQPISIEQIFRICENSRIRIGIIELETLSECHAGQRHSIFNNIGHHISIKDYHVWKYIHDHINIWDVQMAVSVLSRLPPAYMVSLVGNCSLDIISYIADTVQKQIPFKEGALRSRYIDLSIIIIKRMLVLYLQGQYSSDTKFNTILVQLIINTDLTLYDPWLLRNINAVFDIDRHINKMKLVGGL